MDENNIIDLTEETQKKQPWYKKAWKKTKEIAKSVWEWLIEDGILAILGMLFMFLWGFIVGIIGNTSDEESMDEAYKQGTKDGYLEAIQNIKDSGYQVYGGYGKDCEKMVITKFVEEAIIENSTEEAVK